MVEIWHEWEARLPTRQHSEWWRVDMNGKRGYRQDNILNGGESTWMGREVTDRTTFWVVESWHEWEARSPTGQPSEGLRVDMNGKRGYRHDTLLNGGKWTWMGSERLPTGQPFEWWRVDMNGMRGYRQDNLPNDGESTWMGSEFTDRTTSLIGRPNTVSKHDSSSRCTNC